MKPVFRLLVFVFLLTACSPSDSVPKNVLPPAKMGTVFWDMLLADQMADFYTQKDSSSTHISKYAGFYEQLFQIHKITKEEFRKSMQFYESRPYLLKPILDSLQKKSERLTANKKPVS